MVGIPLLLVGLGVGTDADDLARMQGTWRVTSLVENGKVLTAKQITANFATDQTVVIDGPTVAYRAPELIDPVRRPFTLNAKAEPKEMDIIGGQGGRVVKGIYGLFGDSLMICFPTADGHSGRPTEFSSLPDSEHVIMTLKRVTSTQSAQMQAYAVPASGVKAAPAAAKVVLLPPAPPAPTTDQYRQMLIGTWGHQTEDAVAYTTFNPDGTYSSTMNWKSGFKKTFHPDVRSSGTWKFEGNTIVFTVTASTSSEMRSQIYSYRLVSLAGNELVIVDGMGRLKRDWKVR